MFLVVFEVPCVHQSYLWLFVMLIDGNSHFVYILAFTIHLMFEIIDH